MYGAILGDIIGSAYEFHNVKTEDFPLFSSRSTFTDDTVLSVAVAHTLLSRETATLDDAKCYATYYKQYYRRYPTAGFGQMFANWAAGDTFSIQQSYGNGAAMRVAAIGYAFNTIDQVKQEVKKSCFYTHNNKEAILGAQAIALCILLARTNHTKEEIRSLIKEHIGYKLDFTPDEIRPTYVFNSRTSYTIPPAIVCFLVSSSYEDAIRKAISLGGDSDTLACMAGGIAEAFYKEIPTPILTKGKSLLDMSLRSTIDAFLQKYH